MYCNIVIGRYRSADFRGCAHVHIGIRTHKEVTLNGQIRAAYIDLICGGNSCIPIKQHEWSKNYQRTAIQGTAALPVSGAGVDRPVMTAAQIYGRVCYSHLIRIDCYMTTCGKTIAALDGSVPRRTGNQEGRGRNGYIIPPVGTRAGYYHRVRMNRDSVVNEYTLYQRFPTP